MVLKVFLTQIFLLLFLLLPGQIFADGVQLSTTQVGSTATFTSQLPADPCGAHKLGETKTRTVVGFIIATTPFEMGDDKVMRIVNERRADLTDATIWSITIAGKQITDFVVDPDTLKVTNWKDFIHSHRTYKLSSPIEYSPQDTASIVVTNVKISAKGTIQAWFGLQEPTGIYCLSSIQSVITLGESQKAQSTNLIATNKAPSPNVSANKSPTVHSTISPKIHVPTTTILPKITGTNNNVLGQNINEDSEKKVSPLAFLFQLIEKLFGRK